MATLIITLTVFFILVISFFLGMVLAKIEKKINKPQSVHDYKRGYIRTRSGKWVNLHKPTLSIIVPADIPNSLAWIPRFGGHTNEHYSVLMHSYLVVALSPDKLKYAAQFHDATETYLGDVVKPLKNIIGRRYSRLERRFMKVISDYFHINPSHLEQVKVWDRKALEMEYAAFMEGDDKMKNKIYSLIETVIGPPNMSETSTDLFYRVATENYRHIMDPEVWSS